MTKHSIAAFCALTLAAFGAVPASFAVDTGDDGKDVKETKDLKQVRKESCITGDLGVTLVSEYLSRGIVQVNQGVIAQPYLDLYFKLYEGTGFINKVVFNFGLWSNIDSHVEPPGNTATDMIQEAAKASDDAARHLAAANERAHPKRMALPQEIAAAILSLASDMAGFTAGAALPVDGGALAGY